MRLTRRQVVTGILAAPFVLRHRVADALVDPAVVGQWEPRVVQPHIPIHTHQIPGTHYVLGLFGKGLHPASLAWVYDPFTRQILNNAPYSATNPVAYHSLPIAFNGMCGGAFLDDDGNSRWYGGITVGANRSARFRYVPTPTAADPAWTFGPWMSEKKDAYYRSAVRTGVLPGYPSGAAVIAFGRRAYIDIYDVEQYASDYVIPRMPASANIVLYAGPSQNYVRTILLPDGRLALVGTEAGMKVLDLTTARWTSVATLHERRYDGCATHLESGNGYEFLCNAGDTAWTKRHQEIVNMQTGAVRETCPTRVERYQAATAILPDGTVLTAGGNNGAYAPEIWDPVTETATLMAPTLPGADQTARAYHSGVLTLIDGSVLWGGGNPASLCKTFERFLPPYLFRGPRPSLTATTPQTTYGALAAFTTPDRDIDQMVLLAPGVTSHDCNFEQKRIPCAFLTVPGGVQMAMPTNTNLAPPGFYMAFALRRGVPSLGQWIRLAL